MSASIKNFKDLEAWKCSYKLSVAIYKVTKDFPEEEKYGLVSQIRRASVSVPSNIAEGFGRSSNKDKSHFYVIARGSLTEVETQLLIAEAVGYLSKPRFEQLEALCVESQKILSGLISSNNKKGAGD